MARLIARYVEYSRIFGITTLTIRIRQFSWWIEELLKNVNKDIKKLIGNARKINQENFLINFGQIRETSRALAYELKTWMHYLKQIYFHNSAILYIELKFLLRLHGDLYKLKKNTEKENRKRRRKDMIKIINRKVKHLEKELGIVSKTDKELINLLNEVKRGFNKILRNGKSIKTFTFLKEERVTKKIKIKARKIKEIEPKRRSMMSKNIEGADIKKIAGFIHKEIKLVGKDILYIEQLIKKLKRKKRHIEKIINPLGKKMLKSGVEKKTVDEQIADLKKPYHELDNLIEKDLKEIYYTDLRELNMANRKLKKAA